MVLIFLAIDVGVHSGVLEPSLGPISCKMISLQYETSPVEKGLTSHTKKRDRQRRGCLCCHCWSSVGSCNSQVQVADTTPPFKRTGPGPDSGGPRFRPNSAFLASFLPPRFVATSIDTKHIFLPKFHKLNTPGFYITYTVQCAWS